MRTLNRTLFVASVLSAAAPIAAADPVAVPWTRGPNSCGTPQIAQDRDIPVYDAAPAGGQRVLWVNKQGGHFTVSSTDSTKNTVSSNILQTSVSQFTIPKIPTGFDWPVVRACIDEEFSKFNIRVVETRPSAGDFVQAVVGGTGAEIGFNAQSGILGITSTDNFCHVAERGITLNFAPNHLGILKPNQELCATITHEAGHAFSLEHEILGIDLMSYVPVSQAASKEFVDQNQNCGTDPQTQNPCSCTSGQTNSGMRLTANVGARPTDGTAPSLTVQSPSDGKLAPSFAVVAKATDASGMADVVVSIDGEEVGNDEAGSGGTYTIPGTASLGMHMLTVTARDLAGNVTKKDIPVTVAKLEIGETCTGNDACTGNLCATGGDGTMFCTQSCDPAASTCPDGFSCDATAKVCSPSDTGGCCSASTPRQGVTAMLFGLGVGAILIRRKRR